MISREEAERFYNAQPEDRKARLWNAYDCGDDAQTWERVISVCKLMLENAAAKMGEITQEERQRLMDEERERLDPEGKGIPVEDLRKAVLERTRREYPGLFSKGNRSGDD
jgi:hypothetical protein